MDPQLSAMLPALLLGALGVLVVALIVWLVVASASMRRLGARADERWDALGSALARRGEVALGALAGKEPEHTTVQSAQAAVDAAATPEAKAEAEQRFQQTAAPMLTGARQELAGADDEIQAARRAYNTGVRELNAKARRFPTSLFAGIAGGRREFFEVDQSTAKAAPPKIQF